MLYLSLLKEFEPYSKSEQSNQVLKKLVKLHNSQNVNCLSRCEFIRLRIQYGTEISQEIEYQSIICFKALSKLWKVSFLVLAVRSKIYIGCEFLRLRI